VDAEGSPVADVRVGTGWTVGAEPASVRWRADAKSRASPEVRANADGEFAESLYFRGRPVALVALDTEGRRGGITVVDQDNIKDECVIRLEPLIRVRGEIEIAEPFLKDTSLYIYVFDPRAPIAILRVIAEGRAFAFSLPPGSYEVSLTGTDLERVKRTVQLEAGSDDLDLGAIELPATNLARHYGKPPPPWNITAARGVSADAQLADFKGKWVLIEFWSYW
jgi:hypothetical protein